MKRAILLGFWLLVRLWPQTGLAAAVSPLPAELVLRNGFIHTVDERLPQASAVAVRAGRLVYIGDERGCDAFIGPRTRVVDLAGRLVLPGFFDSHCHAISAFKQFYEISLNGIDSLDGYLQTIRDFVRANPDVAYIRGRGWKNTLFTKTGPDCRLIDGIVAHIPVVLSSEDGHSKWVNSKALELAGIDAGSADPPGGVIERDAQTGRPTGTLRESAADLVARLIPAYTVAELRKGLLAYQDMALAFGISSIHDASLDAGSNDIEAYRGLDGEKRLKLRVRASLYADPAKGLEQIAALLAERKRNDSKLFGTGGVKLFMDGVVEGSTAFLKEPYRHLPGFRSRLLWDVQMLNRFCAEIDRLGFQIHVHSIGDAATSVMLDALAYARRQNGRRDSRHAIAHLQLVDAVDIARFAELGVVAVPQPYWFKKDEYYFDMQLPYLGQKRADEEYPLRSFFSAAVVVASSSDYPVTIPCNPLLAIETGISRCEPGESDPAKALWPQEGASLSQMIESFTLGGARANFLETETGSISLGKSADLIVLDRNLFEIPVREIHRAKVLLTLLEGQAVYGELSGLDRQSR